MILQAVSSMLRIVNEGFISVLKENFECYISMLLKAVAIGVLQEYMHAHPSLSFVMI